jgi:hypothetical protein
MQMAKHLLFRRGCGLQQMPEAAVYIRLALVINSS